MLKITFLEAGSTVATKIIKLLKDYKENSTLVLTTHDTSWWR